MHRLTPVNAVIATALSRVMPREPVGKVDWLDVADDFLIAVSGQAVVLAKEDHDRQLKELARAREYLRQLGIGHGP